jgi:hypothetical protein
MLFTFDNPFVGTAQQFKSSHVYLNGKALDAVSIGALARHGLIEDAGDGPKPVRGRTPRLYKVYTLGNMVFSQHVPANGPTPEAASVAQDPSEQSGNADSVDTDTQA